MTIDEAIKHCLEVAEQNEQGLYDAIALGGQNPTQEEIANCEQCAADHRQLAEWLTELKELREKHWDECRQIAHYDDELKEATLRAIRNNSRTVLANMDNLDLHDENRELKRLLKAAVEDFREINSDILTCRYCRWYSVETDECAYCPDDVPCERICGWKHEAEALKLIGGENI